MLLDRILAERSVITMFQPLVSMKRGTVFCVEGLSRGVTKDDPALIPADTLFSLPQSGDELLQLDRLCREKALETFLPLYTEDKSLLISINIDAAIVTPISASSTHLLDTVARLGIHPNNVIIEIIESKAADMGTLLEFVANYRNNGFLIALDDVGAGHSNLDRIPLLKPDIIKIDRSLIDNIDNLFYKKEIVKALQMMASKVGTMVLAEGVEREAEAIVCMELGIEFFQGYFFAKPCLPENSQPEKIRQKIAQLATGFKEHTMKRIGADKRRAEYHRSIAKMMSDEISDFDPDGFGRKIVDFVPRYPTIECVYILNLEGVQISDTFFNQRKIKKQKRFIYKPAERNTDHSLKEYYLPLKAGLRSFTTDPYISMATGNRCTTIAAFFRDGSGEQNILCIDLDCEVLE